MKHKPKIVAALLILFIITQLIGLYVVNSYATEKVVNGKIINATGKTVPYGMGFDGNTQDIDPFSVLISIIFSLIIAVSLIFLLIKLKARSVLRIWFFAVTVLAVGISLTAILPEIKYASYIALGISFVLSFLKFYKRNLYTHNLTELLIYPGIAAIFVPILGIISIIILLIIISVYDMWAVWKSKIMQKMAKFHIEKLNTFGGFFIPYANKKTKEKIKLMKSKYKDKKKLEKAFEKSKLKINAAALGGGDIVFPIIASGVVLKVWGLIPALLVTLGAFLGIFFLLIYGKKKMYPAMPYITAGIFLALLVDFLLFF